MAVGIAKEDLIRPVRREMESTRRAGAAIVASVMLLVACAGLYLSSPFVAQPNILAETSTATAAEAAAVQSEQQVAHFMQEMASVKAPKKPSDAHALDWNWAPELARDKKIPNWVGSEWVRPLQKAARIRLIAPATPHATAPAPPSHATVVNVATVVNAHQDLDASGEERLPAIRPLRFFPTGGLPPLDSQDVVQSAQASVASAQKSAAVPQRQQGVAGAPPQSVSFSSLRAAPAAGGAMAALQSVRAAEAEKAALEAKATRLQDRLQRVEQEATDVPAAAVPKPAAR